MSVMVGDPRDMADPRGMRRPSSSEFPKPLTLEVRFVVEPRSNVLYLRPRTRVLQSSGGPVYDWFADRNPDVFDTA